MYKKRILVCTFSHSPPIKNEYWFVRLAIRLLPCTKNLNRKKTFRPKTFPHHFQYFKNFPVLLEFFTTYTGPSKSGVKTFWA